MTTVAEATRPAQKRLLEESKNPSFSEKAASEHLTWVAMGPAGLAIQVGRIGNVSIRPRNVCLPDGMEIVVTVEVDNMLSLHSCGHTYTPANYSMNNKLIDFITEGISSRSKGGENPSWPTGMCFNRARQ